MRQTKIHFLSHFARATVEKREKKRRREEEEEEEEDEEEKKEKKKKGMFLFGYHVYFGF